MHAVTDSGAPADNAIDSNDHMAATAETAAIIFAFMAQL